MIERKNTFKKNNMLITLLLITMIHHTYAFLDSLNTGRAHKIKLENNLAINPDGGLSPGTHYMVYLSGFMHNFRMYWHGVYREWYLKKKSNNSSESEYIGEYYKNLLEWKVHNDIDEDKDKNKYLQEFAQQLINMFPSEGMHMSIQSNNPDSFTQFLREYKDKSDSLYVLASLFLLSEGINIPIEIVEDRKKNKNKMLILKKKELEEDTNGEPKAKRKKLKEGFHINLSMNIKRKKPVYQKKTEEIVNFFKSLVNTDPSYCLKVPEEFSMPTKYEDFLTGNFLCNPKFLIQSYFFEYIDSVEMYEEFVKAVYELITEQIPNKDENKGENPSMETENKAQEVFNRLFIDKKVLKPEMKDKKYYYAHFCWLKEIRDKHIDSPFINSIQVLDWMCMPKYIQNECRFDINKEDDRHFLDTQDFVLLCIFFCLAFDPETKTYNIDHLPNASKDLKDFFYKYSHPVENINITIQCEWRRVISRLLGPADSCFENSIMNGTGLLSVLYMLSRLVGCTPEIESAIDYIEGLINKDYEDEHTKLQSIMQNMLSSLSRNKKVEVYCDRFKALNENEWPSDDDDSDSDDKNQEFNEYLNMKAMLLYDFGMEWCGIKFKISNCCIYKSVEIIRKRRSTENKQFYNEPTTNKTPPKYILNAIKHVYNHIDRYPKMIINQFFGQNLVHKVYYHFDESFKYNKKKIVDSKCDSPNSLMLWGSLDNLDYKSHLVKQFLIHSSGTLLNSNNPMVRFTSNLIGSVSLNDLRARQHILSGCAYNENYMTYYPQLEYDVCTVPKTELSLAGLYPMAESLFRVNGVKSSALISSCISLMRVFRKDTEILYVFSSRRVLDSIIEEIDKPNIPPKYAPWESSLELNSFELNDLNVTNVGLQNLYRASIFDYFHEKLKDALHSPVDSSLTVFYLCWLFNLIPYRLLYKMENIKPFYDRINLANDLSSKIEDVLGDNLTHKNAIYFIEFLEKNKLRLYSNTDEEECEKKHQEIVSLFSKYTKKQTIINN